jgi:hypothetical protein
MPSAISWNAASPGFPAELSGGMTKLARARALDPAIIFLDEPTSGHRPDRGGRFRRRAPVPFPCAMLIFPASNEVEEINVPWHGLMTGSEQAIMLLTSTT